MQCVMIGTGNDILLVLGVHLRVTLIDSAVCHAILRVWDIGVF